MAAADQPASQSQPMSWMEEQEHYKKLERAQGMAAGQEMYQRFGDNMVGMNGKPITAAKGVPIASGGFSGCIGTYIDNPQTNTIAHTSPGSIYDLEDLLKEKASPETKAVHFFVPANMRPGPDGQPSLQQDENATSALRGTLKQLNDRGIKHEIHEYEKITANEYRKAYEAGPYQNKIWVDEQSNFFAGGKQVAGQQSAPAPATTPTPALSTPAPDVARNLQNRSHVISSLSTSLPARIGEGFAGSATDLKDTGGSLIDKGSVAFQKMLSFNTSVAPSNSQTISDARSATGTTITSRSRANGTAAGGRHGAS